MGMDTLPVNNMDDIANYFHGKSIGDIVLLKILRNGNVLNANITLTARP